MLRRVRADEEAPATRVRVADARTPLPFVHGLEFNAPVHGAWNIVHIGMQVPEAHQIYVCSDNCMRGVVMTADEMGAQDRFSCVTIDERDLLVGSLEDVTIEGVTDVLRRLPALPPCVLLFTVCVHLFTGCDLDYVYRTLGERFPEVRFCRCYMDPITQKTGPTPEQKLRHAVLAPIEALPAEKGVVNLLGCDVPQAPGASDLACMVERAGLRLREAQGCATYREFLGLGDGAANICAYPTGRAGVRDISERLGRPFCYADPSLWPDQIEVERGRVLGLLRDVPRGLGGGDASELSEAVEDAERARLRRACDERLRALADVLGGVEVAIDYTAHPRPLSMARLLLDHGIDVRRVYLEAIADEEEGDLAWLAERHPDLLLCSTTRPELRALGARQAGAASAASPRVLAVGQKAAWFEGTPHFVNMVEGGGLWGFLGILGLCERMEEAWRTERDLRDVVPRKGLGCASVCATADWRPL